MTVVVAGYVHDVEVVVDMAFPQDDEAEQAHEPMPFVLVSIQVLPLHC